MKHIVVIVALWIIRSTTEENEKSKIWCIILDNYTP